MINQELWEFVTPDGEVFNLHDFDAKIVMGNSGTGMPDINYLVEKGPYQHGQTALDYRLQPREIVLTFRYNGGSRDHYWRNRQRLLEAFRPNRSPIGSLNPGTLRKRILDGTEYAIDVMLAGGISFDSKQSSKWDEWSIDDKIVLIANDPIWYTPGANILQMGGASENASHLVFPTYFPAEFAGSGDSINISQTISYIGTWLTYPLIDLRGPMESPLVENTNTGEKLELDYTIPDNDVVTFDLRYGYKTVTDQNSVNLVGYLTTDSDLVSFHIAPNPEVPSGQNEIHVFAANAGANTAFSIQYLTRWIGI